MGKQVNVLRRPFDGRSKTMTSCSEIHSHPKSPVGVSPPGGPRCPTPQPTSAPGLAGSSGRQRAVAEAGEALSSSRRSDVAIVTVDQNLPERLTLNSNRITKSALDLMRNRATHRQNAQGGWGEMARFRSASR